MNSRSAVGAFLTLPVALCLSLSLALAQNASTVVPKSPKGAGTAYQNGGPPESALRPSIGEETVPADNAAPVPEIKPSKLDEGASWDAAVQIADAPTPLIGSDQAKAVQRINAYFNSITNLQGQFEQVDPSNRRSKGRFYVLRPGKIRFDYAPPSSLRIVADGYSLAIEDSDLKTIEKYPIKSTPFRLLLAKDVDLARDSRIVGVEREGRKLAIALEDQKGDTGGHIKLYFDGGAKLGLREWAITDAQGLTTRVTVSNLVEGRRVPADFFKSKEPPASPFR